MDWLISADDITSLVRLEDLFSIHVSSIVVRSQYADFEDAIEASWPEMDDGATMEATVVAIDKYLTESR